MRAVPEVHIGLLKTEVIVPCHLQNLIDLIPVPDTL